MCVTVVAAVVAVFAKQCGNNVYFNCISSWRRESVTIAATLVVYRFILCRKAMDVVHCTKYIHLIVLQTGHCHTRWLQPSTTITTTTTALAKKNIIKRPNEERAEQRNFKNVMFFSVRCGHGKRKIAACTLTSPTNGLKQIHEIAGNIENKEDENGKPMMRCMVEYAAQSAIGNRIHLPLMQNHSLILSQFISFAFFWGYLTDSILVWCIWMAVSRDGLAVE